MQVSVNNLILFSNYNVCVQVQIYRALAAVFKQVVDDIETDFKPHHKAQTWQENLQHRIYDFLNSDDVRKPEAETERASQRENGWTDYQFKFSLKIHISSVAGGAPAPPPPPPPPVAPQPPKPKLLRFPGAEGLKKTHFSGYR